MSGNEQAIHSDLIIDVVLNTNHIEMFLCKLRLFQFRSSVNDDLDCSAGSVIAERTVNNGVSRRCVDCLDVMDRAAPSSSRGRINFCLTFDWLIRVVSTQKRALINLTRSFQKVMEVLLCNEALNFVLDIETNFRNDTLSCAIEEKVLVWSSHLQQVFPGIHWGSVQWTNIFGTVAAVRDLVGLGYSFFLKLLQNGNCLYWRTQIYYYLLLPILRRNSNCGNEIFIILLIQNDAINYWVRKNIF